MMTCAMCCSCLYSIRRRALQVPLALVTHHLQAPPLSRVEGLCSGRGAESLQLVEHDGSLVRSHPVTEVQQDLEDLLEDLWSAAP